MSISPTDAQNCAPLTSQASPNNSSSHGFVRESISSSPSHQEVLGFKSLQISGVRRAESHNTSDMPAPDETEADKKVRESKAVTGNETPVHPESQEHGDVQGDAGSALDTHLSYGSVRSAWGNLGFSTDGRFSLRSQEPPESVSSRRGAHVTGRRGHTINGNHLLNFYYDPISTRSVQGLPLPRRQPKRLKPYNKDLFVQANYKFVVFDGGENRDVPDQVLNWEDIISVRFSASHPVQCPICLDDPLCAQISSCGHIFCFPCILQYMLVEDSEEDFAKKCPLCFMLICPRDLYAIEIETVKNYGIGDTVDFLLLTREKKNSRDPCPVRDNESDIPFSSRVVTSDVGLAVRDGVAKLESWLAGAESGRLDDADIERLPYVSVALEYLRERKKHWEERAARNPKSAHAAEDKCVPADGDANAGGFFYQADDGQRVFMHPLNLKCLLRHYGDYNLLPHRITGEIVQLETVTQSEAVRRRYRYLSHLPLTTTFQFCEVDLSLVLPPHSLEPFMDEIRKRDKQRKRTALKEEEDRVNADAAADSLDFTPAYNRSSPAFSMDDFEALGGSAAGISSCPPCVIGERPLFSSVARLGFAACGSPPGAGAGSNCVSFVEVISRERSVEGNAVGGKKGRRPLRVLMSTARGRRY